MGSSSQRLDRDEFTLLPTGTTGSECGVRIGQVNERRQLLRMSRGIIGHQHGAWLEEYTLAQATSRHIWIDPCPKSQS